MPDVTLPHLRFSTAVVPSACRFELYKSLMAVTWEVSPWMARPEPFNAAMIASDLGTLLVSRNAVAPQILCRPLHRARADGQDHYMVVLMEAGRAQGEVGDGQIAFEAGEMRLFDMARSFKLAITATTNLILLVHRDDLDGLTSNHINKHGLRLDGAAAALFREHMLVIAGSAPRLNRSEAPGVCNATIHLLAACLAAAPQTLEPARIPLHAALIRQARRFVDANLAATLSVDEIGRALGVSRSGLYRLMEPFGGVTAFVQQRRLVRVHARLSDPNERRQIAELALSHGFANQTHFSRSFRRHFGYAPSEARRGLLPPANADTPSHYALDWPYRRWLLRA